jgi:hypothetical protein
MSMAQLGDLLGTSKQAAHKRFNAILDKLRKYFKVIG